MGDLKNYVAERMDRDPEFKELYEVGHYCRGLNIGEKIKFRSERQRFTVRAKSDRYLICTKPFNLKKTCLYTIVDLERFVRGTNDLVFNNYDYMLQEDIDKCLADLESEKIKVTHRNCVKLDVEIYP